MQGNLLRTSKALADETRFAIIQYMERKRRAVSIKELAQRFRLHPSAIRQHLSKLSEAQLVSSVSMKTGGSGRPQRVYRKARPVAGLELLPRDYRLLCEMLLGLLAIKKVSIEEIKAFGRQWGEGLAKRLSGGHAIERSAETVARFLADQFGAWGFEPRIQGASGQQVKIQLHNCIFKEVVEFNPEIVCPLLHGVLEGLLSPFVGPSGSSLQNGIVHGEDSCLVNVQLKPSSG
jgi:predicted ArsR family transcriptional regulator